MSAISSSRKFTKSSRAASLISPRSRPPIGWPARNRCVNCAKSYPRAIARLGLPASASPPNVRPWHSEQVMLARDESGEWLRYNAPRLTLAWFAQWPASRVDAT